MDEQATPKPTTPAQMQEIVERLKKEGRMPSPDQLLRALDRTRAKYRQRILDARAVIAVRKTP